MGGLPSPEVWGTASSLSEFIPQWTHIAGEDSWLTRTLKSGFHLPWGSQRPPLSPNPFFFPPPAEADKLVVLAQEVQNLLLKGAVEEVSPPFTPGFYGRLFCVQKSSGGWRPVLDLSSLNQFLLVRKFKMETLASIRQVVRPGDWAASIDLSDAYFHIPIAPAHRKFLRFAWGDRVFQFRVLPFGLSLAPWVFTRVVRVFLGSLRVQGIRIYAYLDDWLVLACRQMLCRNHILRTLNQASSLGFRVNLPKSDLEPSQVFKFLGTVMDSINMTICPSPERIDRLVSTLLGFKHRRRLKVRQFLSLLGSMESLASIVPLGRVHKRPLQFRLKGKRSSSTRSLSQLLSVGRWFWRDVRIWTNTNWLSRGVPLVPLAPTVFLYTDASLAGWGGHLGSSTASGRWPNSAEGKSINWLELKAVQLCLRQFAPQVQSQVVQLFSDNSTVVSHINKQGGARSSSLSNLACKILVWCSHHQVVLSACHLAGTLNILADLLSRPDKVLSTEWTLSLEMTEFIWGAFHHRPQIDLFATQFNHRLSRYVSPVRDPLAVHTDAFQMDWSQLDVYIFPPFPIISRVLTKIRIEKPVSVLLVLPWWPAHPWWPLLLELQQSAPLPLPLTPGQLTQPISGQPHGNLQSLSLHVWRLQFQ